MDLTLPSSAPAQHRTRGADRRGRSGDWKARSERRWETSSLYRVVTRSCCVLRAKWELETKHRGGREATEEKRRRRWTGLPGRVREKERLDNGSGVKAKLPKSSAWGRTTPQGLSSGARGQGERGKVRPEGGSENQQEPRALKTPLQSFSAPSRSGLPSSQPPPARPLTE